MKNIAYTPFHLIFKCNLSSVSGTWRVTSGEKKIISRFSVSTMFLQFCISALCFYWPQVNSLQGWGGRWSKKSTMKKYLCLLPTSFGTWAEFHNKESSFSNDRNLITIFVRKVLQSFGLISAFIYLCLKCMWYSLSVTFF